MKKLILSITASLFLLSLFIKPAVAQESSLNITVNPIFFDYDVEPGTLIQDRVRIRNNNSDDLQVNLEINKLTADEIGSLTIDETSETDDFVNWINLSQTSVNLPAGEWIDVPFSISVPQDAANGYYYTITVAKDPVDSEGNTVAVSGGAVVPILLTVQNEGAVSSAELVEFKAKNFINEFLPVDFVTRIKNTGNLHIRPTGNIFISGQGNKDLAILNVNENNGTIIPSEIKEFTNNWGDGFFVREPVLENGEYKLDQNGNKVYELKMNWDKLTHFRFGPYTANLFMVFDDGVKDVTIESSTTFWVIPYKLIAVILIALFILIFGIQFMLNQRDKKVMKKYSKKK